MGMPLAQFLVLVGGEVDNGHAPPFARHPRGFAQGFGRVLREMEHLMEQHRVDARRSQRQAGEIPVNHLYPLAAEMLEPRAGDAQHRRAFVERHHSFRAGDEDFRHSTGAGTDVEHMTEGRGAERTNERAFHQVIGAVQAAQFVPSLGVSGEIILCLRLARGPGCRKLLPVAHA